MNGSQLLCDVEQSARESVNVPVVRCRRPALNGDAPAPPTGVISCRSTGQFVKASDRRTYDSH